MAGKIVLELPGIAVTVYEDGLVSRLHGEGKLPPSTVVSKDTVISQEPPISVRLYLPKSAAGDAKLPLLVYFHGGGFIIESASSPTYHNYLNSLVSAANVVAVSVDYRRAPEHPLPAAYDDSWAAVEWVAKHVGGKGPEDWINQFADFQRVFFAGDSAGGNITHHMALKFGSDKLIGSDKLNGVKLIGNVLIHPYFGGTELLGSELEQIPRVEELIANWRLVCPQTNGLDDPLYNPAKDPKLGEMGCEKVLVFVAEEDALRDRGVYYAELLGKSGWKGVVEVVKSMSVNHCFYLSASTCGNAVEMQKKIVSFINPDQ